MSNIRTAAKRTVNLVGSTGGQHEPDFSSFDLGPARDRYFHDPGETETWFSQDYDERLRLTIALGERGVAFLLEEENRGRRARGLSLVEITKELFFAFLGSSHPLTWEALGKLGIKKPSWLAFQPFLQDWKDMVFRMNRLIARDRTIMERVDPDPFFVDDDNDE